MSSNCATATSLVNRAVGIMDPRLLIDGCEAGCRLRFRLLLLWIAMLGYGRVTVTYGKRTLVRQQSIFGQGRTEEECRAADVPISYSQPDLPKVTWCRPEDSKHVRGLAIDVTWGLYKGVNWGMISSIAAALGLTWGGDWDVKDYGHFEV